MDDRQVAVLLEDLRAQFRTFGEGLQLLNQQVEQGFSEVKAELSSLQSEVLHLKLQNQQEHQQLRQMIQELDNEVQVEVKRVK
ncbi:hypothetical protein [Hydrogenispora ethanolica]|uniref:hypothetical protein n=1 Tax=Hydrogenispora ethanolica TaxID=1082276 RepID=UPI0010470992|nr:hypothetical protein [Hydrogenispora ethanolica]